MTTTRQNFKNRTLFHGDNLDFLRGMNSETVDLIATDPPFNKNRDFHATPDSLTKGARFVDRWRWDEDVHPEWVDQIKDDWPGVHSVVEAARMASGDDMAAFLCWLGVRLVEMRRVLKPTGSIYLHIDHTAHAWTKALMDAVFGRKQFRNEIVWRRYGSHNDSGRFGHVHDTLLAYGRNHAPTWNGQWKPLDAEYVEKAYRHNDARGRYRTGPLHSGGLSGGGYKYEFRGYTRAWRYPPESMNRLESEDRIHQARGGQGIPERKIYLDDSRGVPVPDLWDDIGALTGKNNERVGYPTQKPLALYERIIKASSNPGDMVLDPFAGCATTCVAAERLDRQWVGMDIWQGAHGIVVQRLQDNRQLLREPNPEVHYETAIPTRTDEATQSVPDLKLRVQAPVAAWQKLTNAEIRATLEGAQGQYGHLVICGGCGRELEAPFMEIDHINPRAQGGANDITNRILLCGPCNRRKSDGYTLIGLTRANNREGWMRDRAKARLAQDSARIRAEEISRMDAAQIGELKERSAR